MVTKVHTWYLELTDLADLRASGPERLDLRTEQTRIPCPALNRFFYAAVGRDWGWTDRLAWTDQQWLAWLDRPELQTWIGYVQGTPVGYFELEAQTDPSTHRPADPPIVEIAYFGLLPQFVGQRLGGTLLTHAVRRAFEMGAARVWLHTCSLDHPGALSNYQARGFRMFREDVTTKQLADRDLPSGPQP